MTAARRGATGLSGILIIDKPSGMTSHDIVAAVRRATGERRVGHAGTLDPAATGVLVVLVGPATRLAPYLTAARKSYSARIVFGTATDTDDAEGTVVETADVPDTLGDPGAAAAAVDRLVGTHEQRPPAFSAIKRGGVVAHRAARAGAPLDLDPRAIQIFDASLDSVDSGPPLAWEISLTVSKGTYIRSIARDLGAALDTCAHLGSLRRTASGSASLTGAHTLDEISSRLDIQSLFADPVDLLGFPVLSADEQTSRRVADGTRLPADSAPSREPADIYAVVHGDRFLALYRRDDATGTLKPDVVLPGGIER